VNILIAGDSFGFPNGAGATARVHAYAGGLQANSANVRVVCLKTSERREAGIANVEARGAYEGIPFEYTCGETIRAKSFWRRRWLELKGALRFCRILRYAAAENRIDAVIVFSNSAPWIVLIIALSKWIGAICIQEKSEFPFVYARKTPWLKLYAAFYVRLIYRLFDGMIVISTYLERYFSGRVRRGARILRVPILVDVTQFERVKGLQGDGKRRLVYMGNLDHAGEVSSLIETFALIAAEHPEWHLQVIGSTSDQVLFEALKRQVAQLNLSARVEFTGAVRRDDLPRYLGAADVLVLLRSAGIFSEAGFPTKLGEYLTTGKPVVVTSTGDIPLYLEDGVSAFLVPPDDVRAFANKLRYVLSHPAEAAQVGWHGREVAKRYFDRNQNCLRILEFIRGLVQA
jgi:glycosyltransferase involved in cell wall biosynthesis